MANKTTTFTRQILFAFFLMIVLTASQSTEDSSEEQKDCPKFCTKEYAPVCAAFGELRKTFPNPCTLKAEECATNSLGYTFLHNGKCILE